MSRSFTYSERLGAITDAQFAAAAERWGLGGFVSAAPIARGLFGQNVFLTTTAGEFVFRGVPHWVKRLDETVHRPDDRLQFKAEGYFVDQLHEHTDAPVPWPYRYDPASDIFGWPYAIMPRMPGLCISDREVGKTLGPEDRRAVAVAAAATLAELHRLTWPFAGGFDVDTIELAPDPGGGVARLIAEARSLIEGCRPKGVMTAGDMAWIERIMSDARSVKEPPSTFVHRDYKLDNLTLVQEAGGWRIGGVFDFHTARFGDGGFDLIRMGCSYLDTEPALAPVFVDAYRTAARHDADLAPLMPLYVVLERGAFWQFFADKRPKWSQGKTFRDWAEPYVEKLLGLV
jgi:hygromycin-B 7''-O-kinase